MYDNKYESIEEYIKDHIESGYIDENFAPLKCMNCDSKDFNDVIKDRNESGVLEYEVICNNCKKRVGYWAYGHWEI